MINFSYVRVTHYMSKNDLTTITNNLFNEEMEQTYRELKEKYLSSFCAESLVLYILLKYDKVDSELMEFFRHYLYMSCSLPLDNAIQNQNINSFLKHNKKVIMRSLLENSFKEHSCLTLLNMEINHKIVERNKRNKKRDLLKLNIYERYVYRYIDKNFVKYPCYEMFKKTWNKRELYKNKENYLNIYHDNLPEKKGYLKVSYKNLVQSYFKGFKFDYSPNAPKLSKQLLKQGFDPTQKEIAYFGEIRKYFKNAIESIFYRSMFEDSLSFEVKAAYYLDTKDFTIPVNVDKWAFVNSCNHSDSEAGSHTNLVLKYLGYKYLKIYNFIDNEPKPFGRAYFYKKGKTIAHAGMYSNTLEGDNKYNKINLEMTTVLLCILFDRKIDEFDSIEGHNIKNKNLAEEFNISDDYYCNFWSNMSQYCDYKKLGTGEIKELTNNEIIKAINYAMEELEYYED